MKIQPVQNNNTNFQGLYGNKAMLQKINNSQFKPEIENLSKKFDVVAQKRYRVILPSMLAGLSGVASNLGVSMLTADPKVLVPATIMSIVATFGSLLKCFSQDSIQFGELSSVHKNLLNKRLKFTGIRTRKFPLSSLSENRLKYVDKALTMAIIRDRPAGMCKHAIFTHDAEGNSFFHKADDKSTVRDAFEKLPREDFLKALLTPNYAEELPIHNKTIMNDVYLLESVARSRKVPLYYVVKTLEVPNGEGERALDILKKYGSTYIFRQYVKAASKVELPKNDSNVRHYVDLDKDKNANLDKENVTSLINKFLKIDMLDEKSMEKINEYIHDGKVDLLKLNMYSFLKFDEASIDKFENEMTTPDEKGNLPAHYIKDKETLKNLNAILKDRPKVLAEIYLTKNNEGFTPLQTMNVTADEEMLRNIFETLKSSPIELGFVFKDEDAEGNSVYGFLENEDKKAWRGYSFFLKVKSCISDYRHETNARNARLENLEIQKIIRHLNSSSDIIKILNCENVNESYGESLNTTKVMPIVIDYLLEKAKDDEKRNIIQKLKKLPLIDYSQTDKNGISVVEKIMNAEDLELIKLLRDKKLKYNEVLDYTFDNITNDDVRNEVLKLNFEFEDLEEAVKLGSMRVIKECEEQFNSPLYKVSYNGEKLLHWSIYSTNSTDLFRTEFESRYRRYLSN